MAAKELDNKIHSRQLKLTLYFQHQPVEAAVVAEEEVKALPVAVVGLEAEEGQAGEA